MILIIQTVSPVSYTHLSSAMASLHVDRLTARHPMHQILIRASAVCGVLFILQYMMPNVWGPVSYTHLDVYKRQPLHRLVPEFLLHSWF